MRLNLATEAVTLLTVTTAVAQSPADRLRTKLETYTAECLANPDQANDYRQQIYDVIEDARRYNALSKLNDTFADVAVECVNLGQDQPRVWDAEECKYITQAEVDGKALSRANPKAQKKIEIEIQRRDITRRVDLAQRTTEA